MGGQIGKVKNSGQPEIFTTGVIKLAPGESKTFNGRGGFLYLMPQEHCTGYYNVGIWSSTPKLIEYAGNAITAFLEVTKAHSSIDVTIKNITAEKKTLDVQYIAIGIF